MSLNTRQTRLGEYYEWIGNDLSTSSGFEDDSQEKEECGFGHHDIVVWHGMELSETMTMWIRAREGNTGGNVISIMEMFINTARLGSTLIPIPIPISVLCLCLEHYQVSSVWFLQRRLHWITRLSSAWPLAKWSARLTARAGYLTFMPSSLWPVASSINHALGWSKAISFWRKMCKGRGEEVK